LTDITKHNQPSVHQRCRLDDWKGIWTINRVPVTEVLKILMLFKAL